MIVCMQLNMLNGAEAMEDVVLRYDMLSRTAECASARGVKVLAFGIDGERYRLVLEGEREAIHRVVHGIKSATVRQVRRIGFDLLWGTNFEEEITSRGLTSAVAWCHLVFPGDPLSTPWTSHRDLLGYRQADFYHAPAVRCRIDLGVLRERCCTNLPGRPSTIRPAPLPELMRVSACVLGVLPSDRISFRLFVHLGRTLGYDLDALARALTLTVRRIRQLLQETEPMLSAALTHLADLRLAHVP